MECANDLIQFYKRDIIRMSFATVSVFFSFLQRDYYVAKKQLLGNAFNWGLLVPMMYVFMYGYVRPRVFLGSEYAQIDTIMFIGSILLSMQNLSFKASAPLLFDLMGDRYVDYQVILLRPCLVIMERLLFTSMYTCLMLLPYYGIAKLILQEAFRTTATSWPCVFLMLVMSSVCMSAYHIAWCCSIRSPQGLRQLWVRYNSPLSLLGGFWVPWHLMFKASPFIGYVSLLNPCIYSTEGLRSAFLQRPEFLSVAVCACALTLLTILFIALALYNFKRRIDHL